MRDPIPAFFMERSWAKGILATNEVLVKEGLTPTKLLSNLEAEPIAKFLYKLMAKGRQSRKESYIKAGKNAT